jgi:hypothetical protein
MHSACVLSCALVLAVAAPARGQFPLPPIPGGEGGRVDSAHFDSTGIDSVLPPPVPPLPPPPPTPEQERFLRGLQRVGRGVAQLKTAVDRATRAEASRDTVSQRRASNRLGGYCGSARAFMAGARPHMDHTAYADSTGPKARRLARAVDDILKYVPTCEAEAATQTTKVVRDLVTRLQAYEAALADFRTAIGLPSMRDTGATTP